MRRTAAATSLAACLVLAACAGDGFDERFPSLGVLPNAPAPMPQPPAFRAPLGPTNIAYGDVVLDGLCSGILTVKNSLSEPAGIEVEIEFYRDERVLAVRRYAWWPATRSSVPLLPTERTLAPGETGLMELSNDAIEGHNGTFREAPTGCRVTGAHLQPRPAPRPCEEKHGPGCTARGQAYRAGTTGTAPAPGGGTGASSGGGLTPAGQGSSATAGVTGTYQR